MKIIKMRFYLFFTGLGFIIALCVGIIVYMQYQKYISESYTGTLTNVALLIEKLYPEMHEPEILKQRSGTDWFWEKSRGLADIKNSFGLMYIYYVEHTDSGYMFLMSSGIQKDEHPEWLGGPVWKEEISVPACITAARETKKIAYSTMPTKNEWGEAVSVGLPIITDGKLVGILGADYDISYINALQRNAQIALVISLVLAAITVGIQALIGSRFVITPLQKEEANERTRVMIDATPMMCTLWDENGRLLDCNQTTLDLFGFREKHEYLEHFYELNPEFQPNGAPTADEVARTIRAALDVGYQRFGWMFRTVAGEPFPVETTLVRVAGQDGYRIAVYSRDLREIIVNEQKLHEAEERVRVMFDSMPIACSLQDEHGNILDCNPAMFRMFDLSSVPELIEHFFGFIPETQPDGMRSKDKAEKLFQAAFAEGYQRCEWMYRTSSGEPLPVQMVLVRVSWRDGYRLAAYSRDLRETKANEQRMREVDERSREMEVQTLAARAASEAKSSFLASMSHEIRTPMNVIIGMSEIIPTDNLNAEQLEFFHDIRKMAKALLQIINDILDFSKIEMGKLALAPVHFNLLELCDNIISLHRFMAEAKGLEFRSSFDTNVPQVIYSDDVRVRQIVTNVINNAIKYTREGYVDFRVKRVVDSGKEYVGFIVEDSGIGIKKENYSKIFETFEQLDRVQNRKISGTGLGLSIVRHLVDMMGGKVDVASEYGKGSVFTVLLPLPAGDLSKIKCEECGDYIMVDGAAAVLVVDDNQLNLKVALAHLEKHNIHADSAESGKEAMQKVLKKRYDLLFMDHMMPEMDGIETTTRIRALDDDWYRSVPIIALSANAITGARELFLANGMNDYLAKPIVAVELNNVIAKWLPPAMLSKTDTRAEATPQTFDEKHAGQNSSEWIDTAAGLKNSVYEKALYQQLLADFQFRHGDDLEKIKTALEAGDIQVAHRLTHTLKSTATAIGAKRLGDAALVVEKSLSKSPPTLAEGHLEKMKAVFDATIAELAGIVPQASTSAPTPTRLAGTLDKAAALALIDKLEPLLTSGNTACFTLLDDIRQTLAFFETECGALVAFVRDFEFAEAAKTLAGIKQKIQNFS